MWLHVLLAREVQCETLFCGYERLLSLEDAVCEALEAKVVMRQCLAIGERLLPYKKLLLVSLLFLLSVTQCAMQGKHIYLEEVVDSMSVTRVLIHGVTQMVKFCVGD